MYESSDLRKGLKMEIDGEPYIIVQFEFVKPGKGQALYKCKLKNMITGAQFDRTYRSSEKFNEANLEEHEMEYLYAEGNLHYFMNTESFEQIPLDDEVLGDLLNFMLPGIVIQVEFFEGKPMGVDLPSSVELEVVETEPELRGATASASYKPAVLETGVTVQVPPFIKEGDRIRVNPVEGTYMERAK